MQKHLPSFLMRSLLVRYSRLQRRKEHETIRQIIDIVSWQYGDRPLFEIKRYLKRLIMETEYDLGFRQRRYNKRETILSPGCCVRHADRPGIYIIDGNRYCRPCGVTLRRKKRMQCS